MTSLVSALVFALAAAEPAAATGRDLESLLALPASPGALALLAPHAGDERAARRIVESVSHADPAVRAAAARLVAVTGLRAAHEAVGRALAAESDVSAAAEQIRAALLLGRPSGDAGLIPVAARHGQIALLSDALAAARGPAGLPLLEPLRTAGLPEHYQRSFVALATRRGREGLNVAGAAALRAKSGPLWATVLALARVPGATLSPGLLAAALGSAVAEVRAATYWHLAFVHSGAAVPSPDVEAALARAAEANAAAVGTGDAAFAHVVLQRARQGSTRLGGDWSAHIASGASTIPRAPASDQKAIARLLTKAEGKALSRRISKGEHDDLLSRPVIPAGGRKGTEQSGLWSAGGLPPGMLRDLLAVTGCRPAPELRAMGFLTFAADGRVRKVSLVDPPSAPGCSDAAIPALALTLADAELVLPTIEDAGSAAPPRTLAIVPLDPLALDCADEPLPVAAERVPDDDDLGAVGVEPPKKLKNVPPWYPGKARAEGRQGVVRLEAIINPSGCIRSSRVVQGAYPDLDAVAMLAVGQWRYTPTVLRGTAVPVIMNVTVNFRLSY